MATIWRVYVQLKPGAVDHAGKSLEREWRHLFGEVPGPVRTGQVYELHGDLTRDGAELLAAKLLADPVTERAVVAEGAVPAVGVRAEIWPKPGVSDPVAETVMIGARDLGLSAVSSAKTGRVFEFTEKPNRERVRVFCEALLMNPLVHAVELS